TMDLYDINNSIDSDQYLVITKQQKNFDKLKPNLIMGLMQMHNDTDDNSCYVDYLQINPKNCSIKKNRRNKGFGTAMIEYLKSKYRKISLDSVEKATKFYQKMGFLKMGKNDNNMIWVIK
ncbi:MAG: GNAT family N-acetyltransferase, partial [bacterium]|nr:GNAT family N-acetyltransferase [bacterium]